MSDYALHWTEPVASNTYSLASTLAAEATEYLLSGELDIVNNAVNRSRECTLDILLSFGSAPTDYTAVEIAFVYTPNGVDFGNVSRAQTKVAVPVAASSGSQRFVVEGVPLKPFNFRLYVTNKTDITLSSAAVTVYSYSEAQTMP